MLTNLTRRPALAGATSVAALLAVAVIVTPLIQRGPALVVPTGTDRALAPPVAEKPAPKVAANEPATAQKTEATTLQDAPEEADALAMSPEVATMAEGGEAVAAQGRMAATGLALPAPAPAADGMVENSLVEAAPLDEMAPVLPEPDTEAFANAAQNPVHVTAEEPVSTFSADVDTASWAVIRSSLNAGVLPPAEAVRIEEMVNYFPYAYPAPEGDQPFAADIAVMPTPWNPGTELVRIGLQGKMPAVADRPALNLVFLIDTSGSMEDANKLPLLKQSLRLMLPKLRAEDRIAIVTYAGSAGEVLPPTPASDRAAIDAALDRLEAGGSTAGAEGIELAYQVARGMARDGAVSRVLLATDGDFNVGISDPDALKAMIEGERTSCTYLSVLGFGRGNLDDATMQALAQNGNGTAAYIDTLSEARKVLVDQLTGALYPIADNVKIQVEWNPAQVAEYRLIGYETRALRREDFNNDKVDAGDIGAGTAVTAIYEVTAPGSPALLTDPLRYGKAPAANDSPELGYLRLRAVAPGATDSTLQETPILPGMPVTNDTRFAAAIAGFGQLLTGATYLGNWGWDQAIDLALASRGSDDFGYRIEAVNLMRTAKALSGK